MAYLSIRLFEQDAISGCSNGKILVSESINQGYVCGEFFAFRVEHRDFSESTSRKSQQRVVGS